MGKLRLWQPCTCSGNDNFQEESFDFRRTGKLDRPEKF